MATRARGRSAAAPQACYVYGIFPGDTELTSDRPGVGDPPAPLGMVRHDGLAALVSPVDPARPLGSPEDLMAHQEIVDASATAAPVLPMRFGAVLVSAEAVAEDLLAVHHDEFTAALRELDGRVQYVVKGRYVERSILETILSENPRAARLEQEISGRDADATRDARIQLGEIISEAVTAEREQDTGAFGDAMAGHCVASVVRDPTHEMDAVHAAVLVEARREKELEQVVGDLAGRWAGRVDLRLLGPMAAYDFVGAAQRGAGARGGAGAGGGARPRRRGGGRRGAAQRQPDARRAARRKL
jgi:Gas vesicle synthesis protein GvpL/GvpF